MGLYAVPERYRRTDIEPGMAARWEAEPERACAMHERWIGRSEGAESSFGEESRVTR